MMIFCLLPFTVAVDNFCIDLLFMGKLPIHSGCFKISLILTFLSVIIMWFTTDFNLFILFPENVS